MQSRHGRNLIPEPELVVRVTHTIDGCSQSLPHRLDSELRITYPGLLSQQGHRDCEKKERNDGSFHGRPAICWESPACIQCLPFFALRPACLQCSFSRRCASLFSQSRAEPRQVV